MIKIAHNKRDFLSCFYFTFLACGMLGLGASWLFADALASASFGLGFLSIGLIVFLWQFILSFSLKPKQTSWVWETFLVFLRYALLGALFYAMISWLVVRWPWYLAGSSMMLPSLILTVIFFDRDSGPSRN